MSESKVDVQCQIPKYETTVSVPYATTVPDFVCSVTDAWNSYKDFSATDLGPKSTIVSITKVLTHCRNPATINPGRGGLRN